MVSKAHINDCQDSTSMTRDSVTSFLDFGCAVPAIQGREDDDQTPVVRQIGTETGTVGLLESLD
jgi:hypothetical protein